MKASFFLSNRSPLALACSMLLTATALVSCDRGPDPKTDTATATSTVTASATEKVDGGALNKFFPKDEGDFDVIFKAEKKGYAEAALRLDDELVGELAISDTANDQGVTGKFDSATKMISGFPSVTRGSIRTAVLAGRFQVQIKSSSDSFTAADREQWLQKFDLAGLANLAK